MTGRWRSMVVFTALLGLGACQSRSLRYSPLCPVDGVAMDITLEVFSDGWGDLTHVIDTIHLESEGPVTIAPAGLDPYQSPPAYYSYARAEGFYTELYHCDQGDTIDVDLDAVPQLPGALAGVIIVAQQLYAHQYLANQEVEITGPGLERATATTDSQGRYGLADLPEGAYTLSFDFDGEPYSFTLANGPDTDYQDLIFYAPMQARPPDR